jgi:hypothetical protein
MKLTDRCLHTEHGEVRRLPGTDALLPQDTVAVNNRVVTDTRQRTRVHPGGR